MTTNSSRAASFVSAYIWPLFGWVLFAQMALMIVVKNSYNLFALLLLLISLLVVATVHKKTLPKWDTDIWLFATVLVFGLVLISAHWLAGRDTFSLVQRPLILIFALPVMLSVYWLGASIRSLYAGLALGMIASALLVAHQFHVLGLNRAANGYNPVPFGQVAVAASAVLLAPSFFFRGWLRSLAMVGVLASLYCVMISGSRGSLLAIAPVLILLSVVIIKRGALAWLCASKSRVAVAVVIITLIAFSSLLAWKASEFGHRVDVAIDNITEYSDSRGASEITSVGIRLELWRSAIIAFMEHPFLGVGGVNRIQFLRDLDSAGRVNLHGLDWTHTHSDYFAQLMHHGLPGLLFVVGLYGVLFRVFWIGLQVSENGQSVPALSGLLSTVAFATCSLTDTPLRTNLPLIFFTFHIAILFGLVKRNQRGIA